MNKYTKYPSFCCCFSNILFIYFLTSVPFLESVQTCNMSRQRHQSGHVSLGINLEGPGWSFGVPCLTAACHLTTFAAAKPQRRPFEWGPMMKCKSTFIWAAYFKCKFEELFEKKKKPTHWFQKSEKCWISIQSTQHVHTFKHIYNFTFDS